MSNQIYKLVYCSRNQLRGTTPEIVAAVRHILESARRNNAKYNITGALLFNEGLFAQTLEGPAGAVEQIFEQIQRDQRHSDVTVLQSGPAEGRDFPEWSMAFAANSDASALAAAAPVFIEAFKNPSAAAGEVLQLLHEVVVQEDWLMAG
jgi:hypothetical protein